MFNSIYNTIFQCTTLSQVRQAHAHILRFGLLNDTLLITRLLSLYANNLRFTESNNLVLHSLPNPTIPSFSTVINAFARSHQFDSVLHFFSLMGPKGLVPDGYLLPSAIKACASLHALKPGKQVHGFALASGYALDSVLVSSLIHMYLRCDRIGVAQKLFDGMPERDVVVWSTMIAGYSSRGMVEKAKDMFCEMRSEGVEPSLVPWNGMDAGFSNAGCLDEAVGLFKTMLCEGFWPDGSTVSCVLPAVGQLEDVVMGAQFHGYLVKQGLGLDRFVVSALLDMYGKCGCAADMSKVFDEVDQWELGSLNAFLTGLSRNGLVDTALEVFRKFKDEGMELNVVTWTSMIASCAQNGKDLEALELFREMQTDGVEPIAVTIPSLIPACGNIPALMHGKEIHCFSLRKGIFDDVYVVSALIDMYAKCGRIQLSWLCFDMMSAPNLVSWNSIMKGYAVHGKANDVVVVGNDIEHYVDKVYNTVMDNNTLGFSNLENDLDQLGVPLSTPLVTGVLHRLRYDERIAFRFFNWAGHQENYSHEPCVYNDMMDILSSTRYKVKQFRIVCDMLEYMKRHDKNTVPVEVLLTILRKYTEKYLTHVQKFAKKKRIRVKTQPEINAFNLLLDALCKCCLVEDAEGLYKKVRKWIKPNADTYNILVFGWCRVRNPTRAMKLMEEMNELGHRPDNFTYNTALDTFCKAGMIKDALDLFEFMRTKGSTISSPTARTYAIIIVALAKNDRMEECFELMGHMISSGCLPDVSTFKDIIEGMCLSGKTDEAYKFLDEMGNKGYPPDIVTYNCFLKVLCSNRKSEEALKLYRRMIVFDCLPSVQTYNMLISMFFEMDDSDGAFETWQEMEKIGCRPDTDTYCVMIEGLFKCNKTEDACFLLGEVINKGIKLPYKKLDFFLTQLSVIGDIRTIHHLSDHMRKFYNPAMARRYALGQKRKSMSLRGK